MKKRIFAAAMIAAMFAGTAVMAQNGLYMTGQDYVKKNAVAKDKIQAEQVFNRSKIKVTKNGESTQLDKSQVFGYQENGQDYRFFNNDAYKIIDNDQFLLYSRLEHIQNGKERTKETRYYFSTEAGTALLPLTKANLKKAFPDNRSFHDLLDLQFRSDKELTAYDSFHKQYKVQSLYQTAANGALQAINR
ncbi:hypothetical protein MKQ68_02970 [Chitinophaga horti]|uniref:Uncharacterized protein n=1 Tax=Chitinophaga horti TaxID=2920382 RepID=A0ABY6J709_9BACT|nr:hypothetical protein [Chitinophaga horti]UYQ94052.1 hypothetical protein MKQ68_02970 [Chitinophaga horti]